MTTDTLELPEPVAYATIIDEGRIIFLPRPSLNAQAMAAIYSADQMRAYATAAVLAERERCARIAECEVLRGTFTQEEREYWGELIASAIRNKE